MATPTLIAIIGPTASGKTALAIKLAKKYNGEIICADSRTVYKGMDISTAKPTRDEQAAAVHHLLDILEPTQPFSVADFKKRAEVAIEGIQSRGKFPILVGGSGLFIDAVLYDYEFSVASERDAQNPRHAAKEASGSKSELRNDTLIIGLKVERDILRERIAARVETMLQHGLVEEIRQLTSKYGWDIPALQTPAFKAFHVFCAGTETIEQAKEKFITQDFQLAKRQMTWFKRNQDIQWVDSAEQAEKLVLQTLN